MPPTASLDPHDQIPLPTHNQVDLFVQRWVAGTNGNLYVPLINKLPRYPIGRWPGRPAPRKDALLLDIGCGWGRWLVAAGQSGYTPIGIDIKVEPLQAARRVMRHFGIDGYVVSADLKYLPFRTGAFDQVYSYSVIQHVHREFARHCVAECYRVLKNDGRALLEFPISHGLTNFRHGRSVEDDDRESWCVRYYSFQELGDLFGKTFQECGISTDCYFGIGVRPEDLDLLPMRYKGFVILSETLKSASRVVPGLKYLSDSVFVDAGKRSTPPDREAGISLAGGDSGNLAVLRLLQCPLTGTALEHDKGGSRLISRAAGKAFPIVDDIPVMIPSQAIDL